MPHDNPNESLREAWESRADSWDEQASDPDEYFTVRTGRILELLARSVKPCSALDVGCANGLLAEGLHRRGYDAYGMDISENMVVAARARLRRLIPDAEARFRRGQDGAIPFEGRRFGLVTAFSVMEYIADHPAFVEQVRAHLEPGGYVAASLVNPCSLYVVYSVLTDLLKLGPGKKWRSVASNCLRTGYWSGGFVDPRTARQVHGALPLGGLMRRHGFELVDEINIHNLWSRVLDRDLMRRGGAANAFARAFGWDHVGVYRLR